MSRSLHEYLRHILDETDYLIEESSKITQEEFFLNGTLKRSFVRSLEIIGEATKHVPEKIKNTYSDMEWRNIAGMRDKLIHAYFGVDYSLVWTTVVHLIPTLKDYIELILRSEIDPSKQRFDKNTGPADKCDQG
jgi:uncharacterized protein with HEPN domain